MTIAFQSYSQRHEDVIVRRYLEDLLPGGFPSAFIDIGAADGKAFSNTLAFYERGWKGCVVEASPYALPALIERYADDPEMDVFAAAVAVDPMPVTPFWVTGDLTSTASPSQRDVWADTLKAGGNQYRRIMVPMLRAADLYAYLRGDGGHRAQRRYSLLSIDVEGSSVEVFMACPLDELGVQVAIVEHDGKKDPLAAYAITRGFALAECTEENAILVRGYRA